MAETSFRRVERSNGNLLEIQIKLNTKVIRGVRRIGGDGGVEWRDGATSSRRGGGGGVVGGGIRNGVAE